VGVVEKYMQEASYVRMLIVTNKGTSDNWNR